MDEIHVSFAIHEEGKQDILKGVFYGAQIEDAATFFWSLKHPNGIRLEIDFQAREWDDFNFRDIAPEQLAQILDSNPTRHLQLLAGTWTAEQSVILATRPYPLQLTLFRKSGNAWGAFGWEDQGTAFVDALERRQSSFGSLLVEGDPFSAANFRRLLNVDKFDKLVFGTPFWDDRLLPLSAKANAVVYWLYGEYVKPEDFAHLDIKTKDLKLTIDLDETTDWSELLISFLKRVATLGHMERFCFSASWSDRSANQQPANNDVACVTDAIINVINSSPKMRYLNLSEMPWLMKCAPELQRLFVVMEGHAGMRTFVLKTMIAEDVLYPWLEQLLSRNRNIQVVDPSGKRISNGTTIDKLFALNRFYTGWIDLITEDSSSEWKSLFVATALTEGASKDFQRSALLLSNHTDMLFDVVHVADLDGISNDAAEGIIAVESTFSVSSEDDERTASSKRTKLQHAGTRK